MAVPTCLASPLSIRRCSTESASSRGNPFSFDEVQAIVTTELGVRISKEFRPFDPEALAAASLVAVLDAVANGQLDVKLDVED